MSIASTLFRPLAALRERLFPAVSPAVADLAQLLRKKPLLFTITLLKAAGPNPTVAIYRADGDLTTASVMMTRNDMWLATLHLPRVELNRAERKVVSAAVNYWSSV